MKHITVVYAVADEAKFNAELTKIMDQFSEMNDQLWSIAAVSMDHEIRRIQLIEKAVAKADLAAATSILLHIDIGNVESLAELSM